MKKLLLLITSLFFAGMLSQAQEEPGSDLRYVNITELGFLAGPVYNSHPAPFTIMNINGIEIKKQLITGIGVGVEFTNETTLPVIVDARYFFRDAKFSPYASLQAGYSFPLSSKTNIYPPIYYYDYLSSFAPYPYYNEYKPVGGIIFNPSIGFKNMFNENLGFTFSVGYRYQRLNYSSTENDDKVMMELNRLSIKLGFIFN